VGLSPEAGETDVDFKERVRAELRAHLDQAKAEGLLVPQVVWGYFPVNADGNDLVVYADDDRTTERERFSFPRQAKEPYLCIADFFRPVDSSDHDYAAFQIVTMGSLASVRTAELFAADSYREYVAMHGLSVEMTEAVAELCTGASERSGIRRRGRSDADRSVPPAAPWWPVFVRLPACPDLEDNAKS